MHVEEHQNIDLKFTFTVNEAEARALDALVGYDFKEFIEMFKTNLGKHYINGHEAALESVFKQLRGNLPQALSRLDLAKKTFAQK